MLRAAGHHTVECASGAEALEILKERNVANVLVDGPCVGAQSYWNAEAHGKNTQFIALMDGMHAGDDPVTH